MKIPVQEGYFHCAIAQLLVVFCSVFGLLGNAQADCKGGVGTDDIIIEFQDPDFYKSDDIVDCTSTGSITLGPQITIPDGAIFNLFAPRVFIQSDVEVLLGSQLRINNKKMPLNDTGIQACADETNNNISCQVSGYPGQDAEFGRDVTYPDDSDGHAGFSFTNLDANGVPLPPSASNWSCVRDNVTGLIWEVKTSDGGLQDKDNTYTWYNSNDGVNGGEPGTQNGGTCIGSSCDTQGFVEAINKLGLCGAGDWRMPTTEELRSLLDYSAPYPGPAIDTDYFPNAVGSTTQYVWSSLPYALCPSGAWALDFHNGGEWNPLKNSSVLVRLVRGGQ